MQAALAERVVDAEREQVVGGDDCARHAFAVEQAQRREPAFLAGIGARGFDSDILRRQPRARGGGLEAGAAQRAGRDVLRAGDMAEAAMAERDQMIHRKPHPRFVVGRDRRQFPPHIGAVDQHHRDRCREAMANDGIVQRHGREHEAVDAARDQSFHQFLLA